MDNKRHHSILFEHLPNELFAEIFSYLNGFDVLSAFSSLNYRFKCLIILFCQVFDFKSISKRKFDVLFGLQDTKWWKLLRISNADDTPGQVEHFFQNYSLIDHFPQLKSFAIVNMKPLNADTLLFQLSSLTNLVSLTIESICGNRMSKFYLPQLKQLVISSCKNLDCIQNFSRLESLEYTLVDCCSNRKDFSLPSTLKRLKVVFINDDDLLWLTHSLRNLSKLIILSIYQKEEGIRLPDGQVWEQLIRSSFPLLEKFQFYFPFEYSLYPCNQIQQVLSSFSTRFYTFDKNCFIRWSLYNNILSSAVIYSLPCTFHKFTIFIGSIDSSISILSNSNNNSVRNIYANMKTIAFEKMSRKYNKIEIINLVINNDFYSRNWIYLLTKMRHLEIQDCEMSSNNFSLLLDNTPNLYSLTAENNVLQKLTQNWTHVSICNQLSRKIRSLKLYSIYAVPWNSNRHEFYQVLRHFIAKCKHLSLNVQLSTEIVMFILQIFRQLQSLHVFIQENDCSKMNVEWLEQQTTEFNHPNSFISHDKPNYYHFWLGKHC